MAVPLASLSAKLNAAVTDTDEVWESRQRWQAALADLKALDRSFSRLRLGLTELADIDVVAFVPGLDALAATLDARLRAIEARLGSNGTEACAQSRDARAAVESIAGTPTMLRLDAAW